MRVPKTSRITWSSVQPLIGLVARLVLGGVFVASGLSKVGDLAASGRAVNAYQIFPFEVARVLGAVLPLVEIALGVLLIIGFATRAMAVAAAVLLTAFVAGIASAWARGLRIDCGCF